jgi:hypothetical protein
VKRRFPRESHFDARIGLTPVENDDEMSVAFSNTIFGDTFGSDEQREPHRFKKTQGETLG